MKRECSVSSSGTCICEKIPNSTLPPFIVSALRAVPSTSYGSFTRITIRDYELSIPFMNATYSRMANQRKGGAGLRRPREEARRVRNEVYRQHIVTAAEKVFAERGFEN